MKRRSTLERKYGKYALKNLTLMLIMCYVAGYIIQLINPEFLMYLNLDISRILHGQVWRLFTWLIIPPAKFDFFTLIMLFFYYSIGTTLEKTWGDWKYNIFLIGGIVFTILGAFLLFGYNSILANGISQSQMIEGLSQISAMYFSTYYVNMSIFLAYSATFPEMQIYLMMIFPIKVKFLGIIYALLIVYELIATPSIILKFVIVASLINVLIFLLMNKFRFKSIRTIQKPINKVMVHKYKSPNKGHICKTCGKTDITNPELEFRFCSRCNGNYEYCQEHLFTHEHIK